MPEKEEIIKTIHNSNVGSYNKAEVIKYVHSVKTSNKAGVPNKLKTGDIFWSFKSNKRRPHIVLGARGDTVVAAGLTTTKDYNAVGELTDRFDNKSYISAHIGLFDREEARLSYIRTYDGKLTAKGIKDIIKTSLRL